MKRRQFLAGLGGIIAARRRFFLAGDGDVVTVTQPYLQNVRSDRATIMWSTDSIGSGYVEFTSDGAIYRQATAQTRTFPASDGGFPPFVQYTARLPHLTPNTTYTYNCVVDGSQVAQSAQFTTEGAGSFKFLAMGDSGMGSLALDGGKAQMRVAQQLSLETASFLLHVGDIGYFYGKYKEFQQNYFDFYSDTMSRMPFFTSPGNHEYADGVGALAYYALHNFPIETVPKAEQGRYYSFDWGNVHFVSLDSNSFTYPDTSTPVGALGSALKGTGDMLNWLARDLQSTRQYWKIVFFHHPPYAGGRNFGDPNEVDVRNSITPIVEANGVQLVLSGHEHSYQRTYDIRGGLIVPQGTGTVYMTLGGGGADLYDQPGSDQFVIQQTCVKLLSNHFARFEVNGTNLVLTAISDIGAQLESVTFTPQPVLSTPSPVSFDPAPSPGSLVKIHGRNLADQEMFSKQGTSPALSGTTLTLGGQPIPLVYVSPTQIVGYLTFAVSAGIPYSITTTNGTVAGQV